MLKFVKEKLVNCGNSREVVEIEKLTDENNELKTQLSLLKNDQAKRKNLNEARQTELIGEIYHSCVFYLLSKEKQTQR